MSILRPKFSVRHTLILLTVLALLATWVGARWRQFERCEKAYQSLVECELGMEQPGARFPSKLFVDAANELRKLKHADAVALAMRIVYPLAFEPKADCPEEWQYWFNIDESYPGYLCLREGIPFQHAGDQSFSWTLEEGRSKVLDRWGQVRPGLLPTRSSEWYDWQRKLVPLFEWHFESRGEGIGAGIVEFIDSLDRIGFDGSDDEKIGALRGYADGQKARRFLRSRVVYFAKELDIDLSNEDLDEWEFPTNAAVDSPVNSNP